MEYIEVIIKGIITGVLCAYLVLFGLRPAVPYPEFILELFEHLWVFVILFVLNYYVFLWDYDIGIILLLCIIALIFDYIIFTSKGFKKIVVNTQDTFTDIIDEPQYVPLQKRDKDDKKEKNIFDLVIKDIEFVSEQYHRV